MKHYTKYSKTLTNYLKRIFVYYTLETIWKVNKKITEDSYFLIRISKKSQYLDDDVPKGERIFYQVRAVNSKGDGPLSAPVSRVQ